MRSRPSHKIILSEVFCNAFGEGCNCKLDSRVGERTHEDSDKIVAKKLAREVGEVVLSDLTREGERLLRQILSRNSLKLGWELSGPNRAMPPQCAMRLELHTSNS